MKRGIGVVAAATLIAAVCGAPCLAGGTGTTAANFLKLGPGARPAAMGEAFAGLADDVSAAYWNPAGLSGLPDSLQFTHGAWFEGISYQWITAAFATDAGTIAGAVQYLSYGDITETDSSGIALRSFRPSDLMLGMAYGSSFRGVEYGLSLKYISSKITNTATAFALDAGIHTVLVAEKISGGLVLQNLGAGMRYVNEADPLPASLKAGFAYRFADDLVTTFDVNMPVSGDLYFCAGGEKRWQTNRETSLAGRAGFSTKDRGGGGISFGFGVNFRQYGFDYAFVPMGKLGMTHRVSLSMGL